MIFQTFIYVFLLSLVGMQAYPEENCCALILGNMTLGLSTSKIDTFTQSQETRKTLKTLGEDLGRELKVLGSDFGQMLVDLRMGLGADLNENEEVLQGLQVQLHGIGQGLKDLSKGITDKLGEDLKVLRKGLADDFGREMKSMSEELKRRNDELRKERMTQHDEMMNVFNQILKTLVADRRPEYLSGTPDRTANETGVQDPSKEKAFSEFPRDCAALFEAGERGGGVYKIKPQGINEEFDVYCDMEKDGGGWTVFQRRGDFGTPSDYFYKPWEDYKKGFGKLDGEHWLGNDRISALTRQGSYMLHIEMLDYDNNRMFAKYNSFMVEEEQKLYKINIGNFSGNNFDAMALHNGMNFSTYDRDNDPYIIANCAERYAGAWWYKNCHYSNLNAKKVRNKQYLVWRNINKVWMDLFYVQMKTRPISHKSK